MLLYSASKPKNSAPPLRERPRTVRVDVVGVKPKNAVMSAEAGRAVPTMHCNGGDERQHLHTAHRTLHRDHTLTEPRLVRCLRWRPSGRAMPHAILNEGSRTA